MDEKFYRPERFKQKRQKNQEVIGRIMTKLTFIARLTGFFTKIKEVETGMGRVNLN
jgi:hypothetical protein